MRIAVLGGMGIQGRAALADLAASPPVESIICADADLSGFESKTGFFNSGKLTPVQIDASSSAELEAILRDGVDVAIDLLPRQFTETVCLAAIASGVGVVNTNYAYSIVHLDREAKAAGVSIMPECGLDPGIDLILYSHTIRQFEEIHVINSYCGGFPEKAACDNPLNYKVSWTWEGVLSSTCRDARAIKDGRVVTISGDKQHESEWIHSIDFPGLGRLEAIPNGDAVHFTDLLGVTETIRETGRYSLRWPGWSAFWHPLKQLGFLSDKPVKGLPCDVSPYQFLDKLMGPKLQYEKDEKDLVAMVNVFEGLCAGKHIRRTSRMLIERDLNTGLMAMNKGVGFPASIVAQMIAGGEITATGVLSPVKHVPGRTFLDRLAKRGIVIEEEEEILG
ncbi:MAG: saccharopine dehydrogenase C-terminal domain-containing protein [Deltaproteobacteria bacterium]|nr:saccharopine dehydrogenase C-terminal domain-containing protein [Deltaproteobacteria bacterium]